MKMLLKVLRILLGVANGVLTFVAGIWVLAKTLGNDRSTLYQGKTLESWAEHVSAGDVTASNQANAILNAEIIPQLTDEMFHDTNDSRLRMTLVGALNHLPGIWIYYIPADSRRARAADCLGSFGPAAKAAIPALMQAAQGSDVAIQANAITTLGEIHGEPGMVIPLLTKYLSDGDLVVQAATALANYGSLAQSAVPNFLPLLHADDDDAQAAAAEALKKIDPAAYTNAVNTPGT
jgi:hypothetical protein